MSILVVTDSQVYSIPVSISTALMMYFLMTPFSFSGGGGFQLIVAEVESITWPVTFVGKSLGPVVTIVLKMHGYMW